jgi:diaminopimelate decarboxylase
VIPRNYPLRRVRPVEEGEETRSYELAGPLCTSIDTLGHAATLPELRPGDLVAIGASGAYGPTASPLHFLSREFPREILFETEAGETVVTDVSAASVFR